ncbi:MAG: signal peptidase II [Mycoplasma sp.]|nr:signal peptidase II [Mycoplasma sp.]
MKKWNWPKQLFIQKWNIILIRLGIVVLIYGFVIMLDQLTKEYISDWNGNGSKHDWGIININNPYVENTGVAFGNLSGKFALIQIIGFIFLFISLIICTMNVPFSFVITIAFLVGGSLGNMIDRFRFSYVRDFISFPWWKSFAVFNVSDAFAVCSGLYLVFLFIKEMFAANKKSDVDEN